MVQLARITVTVDVLSGVKTEIKCYSCKPILAFGRPALELGIIPIVLSVLVLVKLVKM